MEYLARVVDAFPDTFWRKSDAGVSLTEMAWSFQRSIFAALRDANIQTY